MNTCPSCHTTHPDTTRICPNDGTVLTPAAVADPRVGMTLDGKYRLDSLLGRGGMGSIYRGTHLMLNKPVAVKMINADLAPSPDVVRRFQREAQAASNLNHPNIAAAYDLGQTSDGTLYIAMELISGQSLKDTIRSTGPMTPARIVHILRQVASALSAAHASGIIHRDLKPQNIMLTQVPGGGETAKLLDFGIAKTFDDGATQLTTTGLVLGTPQYMSPEQAAGRPIDGRSDLYSLGIILFEMMVGDVPFNDPSTPAVLVKHLTAPPPLPSERRPDLTILPALEAVALRCLEKEPGARFQSATEFAAALEQTLTAPVKAGAHTGSRAADPTLIVTPRVETPTQRTAPIAMPVIPKESLPLVAMPASSPGPAASVPAAAPMPASVASPPPASAPVPASRAVLPGLAVILVLLLLVAFGAYGFVYGWFGGRAAPEGATPIQASAPAVSPLTGTASVASPPQTPPGPTSPSVGGSAPPTPVPVVGSKPSSPDSKPTASATPVVPDVKPGVAGRAAAGGTASTAGIRTTTPPPAKQGPPSGAAPTQPANPTVAFSCAGETPVCASLRGAMGSALQTQSIVSVGDPSKADIVLNAHVELVDERREQSFGTTFVTRTYSIELSAQTQKSQAVPMPQATRVSYDARVGQDKLDGETRVIAAAAAEKIRTFWK